MSIFGGELRGKKHYVTMAQQISAFASEAAAAAFTRDNADKSVGQSEGVQAEEQSLLPMTGVDAANIRRAFPACFHDPDERLDIRLRRPSS